MREAESRRGREGRGAGSSSKFSFDLFELDEEQHPNLAHGEDLAVLDGQLA
jgi:hypothetical protein